MKKERESRETQDNANSSLQSWRDLLSEITDEDTQRALLHVLQNETRCRSLVETVTDWVWEVDSSGRYTYASSRVKELLGYEPEEVLGRTFLDLMDSEEAGRINSLVGEKFAAGEPIVLLENRLRRKDGGSVLVETNGTPFFDPEGNLLGYRGTDRDVTATKLLYGVGGYNQRILSIIINAIPQAVFWKDSSSIYQGCNQVFAAQMGLDRPEDCIGKTDFDFNFPKEYAESYVADDRHVMETNTPKFHIVEPMQQSDGAHSWVDTTKIPLHDDSGHVVGVLGVYEDITQRRHFEETLARRRRQLEVLSGTSQRLNAVLKIPSVLRRLVAAAIELVDAESGAAALYLDGQMVFSEYNRQGTLRPIDLKFPSGYGVPGHVMNTRAPYVSNDAERDPHVVQDVRERFGFHTLVEVPILSRSGELMGCFEIHNKKDGQRFDKADVRVLEGLAASASVALENSRIMADRLRTEKELRQSKEMLQLVLDTIPAWVFWKDVNSVYLGCNRKFAFNAGLESPEEIIGKTDFDLPWAETEAASYREDDRMVMDTGVPKLNYEETQYTAQGRLTWVTTSKIPMRDEDGHVVGVLGTFEDITERKVVEEALRDSEQRLRLHVEQTPLAVIEWDTEFRIVRWNQAAQDTFGYTADEAVGKHSSFIVPEEVRPHVDEIWSYLLTQKGGTRSTNENVTKDGRTILCEWYNTPLTTKDGKVIGVASLVDEVTERVRAEQEKRAFYRDTILNATGGKLSICDEEDVSPYIKDASARIEILSAPDLREARHQAHRFFESQGIHGDRLSEFMVGAGEAFTNSLKHGGTGCVYLGSNGEQVWVAVSDGGPGIESLILPKAVLRRGFSTKPSLGLGYSIILEVADKVLLNTGSSGTTVVLVKNIQTLPTISLDSIPDTWESIA